MASLAGASESGAGMCTAVDFALGASKLLASLGNPGTRGHRIASYTRSLTIEAPKFGSDSSPRFLLVSLLMALAELLYL